MVSIIIWTLGILNLVIWSFNALISTSSDKSGSGMVLMLTIPISVLISLVSLVIIGFIT